MTQMQKTIEALKSKGVEFKVDENPWKKWPTDSCKCWGKL